MRPTSFARRPLDHILSGGGGGVRVLRALLAHGGALTVARLAADSRMTPDGVRGVLSDLERARVVEVLGSGRTRLYRAVHEHPLVIGLEHLFAAERLRYEEMVGAVAGAAADERIVAVWLFGSVARQEDGPDSDFDVAIVADVDADGVDQVADAVREALREHADRSGFLVSVVSMSTDDVRHHHADGSAFWTGLTADAVIIKGETPVSLAGKASLKGMSGGRHDQNRHL
jgi:predicted nucleotidyltransferase